MTRKREVAKKLNELDRREKEQKYVKKLRGKYEEVKKQEVDVEDE